MVNEPKVAVLIATRDRTTSLERALRSVLACGYDSFEVVVVDNAPSNDTTRELVTTMFASSPVRYVREPRAGLARAHNTGLHTISAPIVAITDDDVVVDHAWLSQIVETFAHDDDVVCVTGAIEPLELDTPAQRWVERHLGFNKGRTRMLFDLGVNRPNGRLFPYAAGVLGSGANMSFRTSFLREMGGFDPALGAGSVAQGGDDLAAFYEVMVRGYRLVYEPGAIVRHQHHRDIEQLEKQITGYGVGLGAFLTKIVLDRPSTLLKLARLAPHGIRHATTMRRAPASATVDDQLTPSRLLADDHADERFAALGRRERLGMLRGPWAYARSRWQTRSERLGVAQ